MGVIQACSQPDINKVPTIKSAITEAGKILTPTMEVSSELTQPTQIPSQVVIPDLKTCVLRMTFTNGPLAGKQSQFFVLGKDYFFDKGEQFDPGKNTAVYYEESRHIILHSAYLEADLQQPLEAEFIRFSLEAWGEVTNSFIEDNIAALTGSQVAWFCDGDLLFITVITGIIRLSEAASTRLWLEPDNIAQILADREGLETEWIGALDEIDQPGILLGFCGWGPIELGNDRFYTYRYLVHLKPIS